MNKLRLLIAVILASSGWVLSDAVQAQGGDALKAKGCTNCHDADKKKVGPALKEVAAKKKPAGEVIAKLKDAKGHPKVNATEDELKSIYDSMLSTK